MAVSKSKSDPVPLILDVDKGLTDEEQSKFHTRPLSNAQLAAVQNLVQVRDQAVNPNRGAARYLALKCGLVGWENYPDENGTETPFETSKGKETVKGLVIDRPVTDATLERLPIEHWNDLGDKILAANVMTADDTKN